MKRAGPSKQRGPESRAHLVPLRTPPLYLSVIYKPGAGAVPRPLHAVVGLCPETYGFV